MSSIDGRDSLNRSMFRGYDIRTPTDRLNETLIRRLAHAEAVYFADDLGVEGVLVARDARASGPWHLDILVETFREVGVDVVLLPGVSSTSYFYFAAMRQPEHGAVMVGASHNPAGDTGQKLLSPGVRPVARGIGPGGGLERIQSLYESGAERQRGSRGQLREADWLAEYIDFSLALAGVGPGDLRGARVLHDYLFGAAGREMILAFDEAGAELTALNAEPDGSFPLGDPNPVKTEVIAPALTRLDEGAFDLAVVFDGDGDRMDIYHGDGTHVAASFVYAVVLGEIRRRFGGDDQRVLADLKCNPLAVIEMARTGVEVGVVRNGHSQIKQSLYDAPTTFGAVEESAHFYEAFCPEVGQRFCTENTLYMALLTTRVWCDSPARVETMIAIQKSTARAREWGYKFGNETERAAALAAVQRHLEAEGFHSRQEMASGMPLEATLMRRGLPFDVDAGTKPRPDWLQVCQRISQSEDGLARWEVVGAEPDTVREAKETIARCVARFGAGAEYQG